VAGKIVRQHFCTAKDFEWRLPIKVFNMSANGLREMKSEIIDCISPDLLKLGRGEATGVLSSTERAD
jgi:hypothetical protein